MLSIAHEPFHIESAYQRWRSSSRGFQRLLRTPAGDVLLSCRRSRHRGLVCRGHQLRILRDSAHPQWLLLDRVAGKWFDLHPGYILLPRAGP